MLKTALQKKIFSKISQALQFISLWGINDEDDAFEKEFNILINQHFILLFVMFFTQSIFVSMLLKITNNTIFLICISFFWILAMFLKELRKNKFILSSVFIFLCLIITYYSSYCGQKSGVFLFYFPLLLGLVFFFEQKKDKIIIVLLAFFILSCLYISVAYDFRLVNESLLITSSLEKEMMFLNITFSALIFLIDYSLIERKKLIAYKLYFENQYHTNTILSLQVENGELLKKLFIANNLTEENVDEIINLAQNNSPFFLERFQVFFPDFLSKLDNEGAQLILSEKHLCAMMRLNLDTKQIATYTNTSVKSVEGKKYRLRKKLNIPSDVEITQWMLSV